MLQPRDSPAEHPEARPDSTDWHAPRRKTWAYLRPRK
jgi:hypothetical protein